MTTELRKISACLLAIGRADQGCRYSALACEDAGNCLPTKDQQHQRSLKDTSNVGV
jgi:hypothetical protein